MKAILFVDDHEVLARLSCEILEMQGYRAVSAYSAADALDKFEKEDSTSWLRIFGWKA